MRGSLVEGLAAAFAATACYGVAPLAQATAARRAPPGSGLGLGLLVGLAHQPLWLLGLLCEAGGFVLEVVAFSAAPVALVAPVLTCDMVVLVLLARRALGERLSAPGIAGIVAMAGGVALLGLSFGDDTPLGQPASEALLAVFLGAGLLFAGTGVIVAQRSVGGTRRAVWFGLSAGVCYAVATLATRQLGLLVGDVPLDRIARTLTPYLLVLFSVLALSLQQRGLQSGAAVVTFPVTSGISAFLPVVAALTMLGEQTPTGTMFVPFVIGLVLVAAGIVGLGRDQGAAMLSGGP